MQIDNDTTFTNVKQINQTEDRIVFSADALIDGNYAPVAIKSFYAKNFIRQKTIANCHNEYDVSVMLNELPNFVKCYGMFTRTNLNGLNETANQDELPYIVYEWVDGVSFLEITESGDTQTVLDLYLQICFALQLAQEKIAFCHYDLHLNNIIIKTAYKDEQFCIKTGTGVATTNIKAGDMYPVIIDFGSSSACDFKEKFYGVTVYEHVFRYSFIIPGFDAFLLLAQIMHALKMQKLKKSEPFATIANYEPYKSLNIGLKKVSHIGGLLLTNDDAYMQSPGAWALKLLPLSTTGKITYTWGCFSVCPSTYVLPSKEEFDSCVLAMSETKKKWTLYGCQIDTMDAKHIKFHQYQLYGYDQSPEEYKQVFRELIMSGHSLLHLRNCEFSLKCLAELRLCETKLSTGFRCKHKYKQGDETRKCARHKKNK